MSTKTKGIVIYVLVFMPFVLALLGMRDQFRLFDFVFIIFILLLLNKYYTKTIKK